MATVPAVLMIGGYAIQGGSPGLATTYTPNASTNIPETLLTHLRDRDLARIVPDDATTGDPTAASLSCYPWYDQNANDSYFVVTGTPTATSVQVTASGGGAPSLANYAGRTLTVFSDATVIGVPIPGLFISTRRTITSNTTDTFTVPSGAIPSVGDYCFAGQGRFTDYHPAAGHLSSGELTALAVGARGPSHRSGSASQTNGIGCGPDATLIRRLFDDVYSSSPYFFLWKWATANGIVGYWGDSPNDSMRTALLAEKVRVDAAATALGHTASWQHCIIDFFTEGIVNAIATPANILLYETQLTQLITWLRSSSGLNNSTLHIVLVNHRNDLYATTGAGAAPWLRAAHEHIANALDGISIVDLDDLRPGVAGDQEGDEITQMSQSAYLTAGERMADAIERNLMGVAPTQTRGTPVYVMFGDSIFVGPCTTAWITALRSERISGPTPGNLARPSNQRVYNRGTGALETFRPGSNSNTSGSTGFAAFSGPELEIMAALGELHPDGFVMVKRASNGSSLATALGAYSSGNYGRWIKEADEHYTELQADFAAACALINAEGSQADMRGAIGCLGQNDQAATGTDGGAAFAAALPGFCDDLWADFSTRTGGDKFPIIWRRPQDDTVSADASEMATIRAALASQMASEPQFAFYDVDDLERDHADDLHETPDSCLISGERAFAALQRLAI